MKVRALVTKGLLCAAIAVGTVPVAAVQASADPSGGCGAGFTEATVGDLTAYALDTYTGATETYWTPFLTGLDRNGDGSVCWREIGKICPCGAHAINVVENNVRAS